MSTGARPVSERRGVPITKLVIPPGSMEVMDGLTDTTASAVSSLTILVDMSLNLLISLSCLIGILCLSESKADLLIGLLVESTLHLIRTLMIGIAAYKFTRKHSEDALRRSSSFNLNGCPPIMRNK